MDVPDGFEHDRGGDDEWVVRRDLREPLRMLLRDAWTGRPRFPATPLVGGRGGGWCVRLDGLTVAIRPYRRGGLPGRVLYDTYCWWGGTPRPFRELVMTVALRQCGVPTAEPLGAAVRWLGTGRYRGLFLTRWIEGAVSLWEALRGHASESARREAVRASAAAIARLHMAGATHPDLNLGNVVVRGGEAWLLDFDRARMTATPAQQRRALARLRRSARKLDPAGAIVRSEDLDVLIAVGTPSAAPMSGSAS